MSKHFWPGFPILATAAVIAAVAWTQTPREDVPAEVRPLVSSPTVPPTMAQCADCHQDICNQFRSASHGQTLWSGTDPKAMAKFEGQSASWPADGTQLRFVRDGDSLYLECEGRPQRSRVDWFFGSGHHAITPVSLQLNPAGESEMRQLSLSWYPDVGLAPTLGQDGESAVPAGMAALGEWLDHAETTSCFGCHTTHLPLEHGQILEAGVIPGISCARCHYDAAKHLDSGGQVDGILERWASLTPRESINRCGECHRRADQMTELDKDPNRPELVRFASVGLVLSRCFLGQDESGSNQPPVRLDCLSCHDPHHAMQTDRTAYKSVCISCHARQEPFAPMCPSHPTSSDCLSCHMPTLKTDANLRFTDHWIRVREQ